MKINLLSSFKTLNRNLTTMFFLLLIGLLTNCKDSVNKWSPASKDLVIGDYVGGVFVDNLTELDKSLYIVECGNDTTLIRQITPAKTKDKYHLKVYNQDIEFPILYNQKIKKAWRIIWIRKRM